MALQRVPVLVCQLRGERTVLPHRTHAGISVGQPYWPTDNPLLSLVCPVCRHLSVYLKSDVRQEEIHIEGHNQPPNVFWRAEFECDRQNCGLHVVVHTRAAAGLSTQAIAEIVFSSKPGAVCGNNHVLSPAARPVEMRTIEL